MWKEGVLGDSDPKALLNTLVFMFGKYFSFRSGEEHRQLKFGQIKVVEGKYGESTSFLQYTSFGEKNYAGGLKHRINLYSC